MEEFAQTRYERFNTVARKTAFSALRGTIDVCHPSDAMVDYVASSGCDSVASPPGFRTASRQ